MASAAFCKFEDFTFALGKKTHDLSADTLKVMLTNRRPSIKKDRARADIAEIKARNGYPAGGMQCPARSWTRSGGLAKLASDSVVFRAGGGEVGPFRYAVLWNASARDGNLLGFWDNGVEALMKDTEFFVVELDALEGILTVE